MYMLPLTFFKYERELISDLIDRQYDEMIYHLNDIAVADMEVSIQCVSYGGDRLGISSRYLSQQNTSGPQLH